LQEVQYEKAFPRHFVAIELIDIERNLEQVGGSVVEDKAFETSILKKLMIASLRN